MLVQVILILGYALMVALFIAGFTYVIKSMGKYNISPRENAPSLKSMDSAFNRQLIKHNQS